MSKLREWLEWVASDVTALGSALRAVCWAVLVALTTSVVVGPAALYLSMTRGFYAPDKMPMELVLVPFILLLLPTSLSTIWCAKVLDGGSVRASGIGGPTRRSISEFGGGFFLGGGLIFLATGMALYLFGGSVDLGNVSLGHWMVLPVWLAAVVVHSMFEESLYRGYAFLWSIRAVGLATERVVSSLNVSPETAHRAAHVGALVAMLCLSSIIFGLMHLFLPGASGRSTINTMLFGLWFAVGILRTRAFWLSIGMHAGWNAAQSLGLGMPLSGISAESVTDVEMDMPCLLTTQVIGPDWATGGDYGIEGSLFVTGVLFLGLLITTLWPVRSEENSIAALVYKVAP